MSEGTPGLESGTTFLLQLTVLAPGLEKRKRPLNLTAVLAEGLEEKEVKQIVAFLLASLSEDDRLSLVDCRGGGHLILPPTKGGTKADLHFVAPASSIELAAGLRFGCKVAEENFLDGALNQVILRRRSNALNRLLAIKKKKKFRNVQVEVNFNTEVVRAYKMYGYEAELPASLQFVQRPKDSAVLFAGDSITALYELEVKEQALSLKTENLGKVIIQVCSSGPDLWQELMMTR